MVNKILVAVGDRDRAADYAHELRRRGVWAEGRIVTAPHRAAAKEILCVTEEQGTDLIVMGSHGQSCWGAFRNGSAAHQVIGQVSCPVTVARETKSTHEPVRRGHPVAVH